MSKVNKMCVCGHSIIKHWDHESYCCDRLCVCQNYTPELRIFTVISVYKINQYAFHQTEAHEFTAEDAARAINANQEELKVPDELEELMQIKHYFFDDLPDIEEKDAAGIIGNGLYRGQKLQVDWRLRHLPSHSQNETEIQADILPGIKRQINE